MKLKKIITGTVAGALAVSCLAASVSAGGHMWSQPEGTECDPDLILNKDMYLIQLFNTGEDETKPAVEYEGLNLNDVAGFKVYLQVMDSEDAAAADFDFAFGDGGFGGGFIYSANGGDLGTSALKSDVYDEETGVTYYSKFNWAQSMSWWGLPAETDSPDNPDEKQGTVDYVDQYTYTEYIDRLHYKMSATIPEEDRWPSVDERKGTCYQIGLQEWSETNFHLIKVNMFIVLDDSGAPMIAFDEFGTPIRDAAEIQKMMDEFDKPQETEAPAENTGGDSTNAPEGTGDAASTDASNSSASTSSAPTTTAASSSNSGNNNTGLIIAIIAVVVVVVVVVVVIVIKKKKS